MTPLKPHRVLFSIAGHEVTLREFFLAIAILAFGLMIALIVVNNTADYYQQEAQKYHTAITISDARTLKYALDTNAGKALISGTFSAGIPVQSADIYGNFSALTRYTERYTQHLHTETLHDKDGNVTGTRTYYTYSWDNINTYTTYSDNLVIHDQLVPINLLSRLPWERVSITTDSVKPGACAKVAWGYLYQNNGWGDSVGDIRWYFSAVPEKFDATIFANCMDKQILPMQDAKTVETFFTLSTTDILKSVDSRGSTAITIICICLGLLFVGAAIGFVMLDNNWLNGQTQV